MSNLIINIRFGSWHLQVLRLCDWRHHWPVSLSHNPYHDTARRTDPSWRWLEFY